ncbi:hypothetical protein PGTUg99_013031 [Puccinia graminis f. sp. tritici]|uniref:Uncharacterized protein n=1 Tax=Puccinia graminis f. sp. tritici TaxID=56615 RepID=A0A5B0Q3R7_PUCGR|nr:hypothetical protein PGTUg99_013031 [Puccinia graminis f. sp. tritici]
MIPSPKSALVILLQINFHIATSGSFMIQSFEDASMDESRQSLLHDSSNDEKLKGGHMVETLPLFPTFPDLAPATSRLHSGDVATGVHQNRKRPSFAGRPQEIEKDDEINQPALKKHDLDLSLSLNSSAREKKCLASSVGSSHATFELNEHQNSKKSPSDHEVHSKFSSENQAKNVNPESSQSSATTRLPHAANVVKINVPSDSLKHQMLNPVFKPFPEKIDVSNEVPDHRPVVLGNSEKAMFPNIFRGWEGDTISRIQTHIFDNGMGMIKGFRVDNLDPKVWPWISVVGAALHESATKPVKKHLDTWMKLLGQSPHLRPQLSLLKTSNVAEASSSTFHHHVKMRQILCLMLALNFRVLQVIDAGAPHSVHVGEQLHLMQWFVKFFLAQPNQNSPHNKRYLDGEEFIYQKLSEAIHSTEQSNAYKISIDWISVPMSQFFVSTQKVLMNKAAVHVLGFYYKNMNYQKWGQIFTEDKYFVLQICNIGARWILKAHRRKFDIQPQDKNSYRGILPWRNPCAPGSWKGYPKFQKISYDIFEKFVEPISNLNNSERLEFGDNEVLDLKSLHPKKWAWISNHLVRGNIQAPKKFKLNSQLTIQARKYISDAIEKKLGKERKLEFQSSNEKIFLGKLGKLIDFIWAANYYFLETLGCESSDESFSNEQRLLQSYLEFILSGEKNKTNQQVNSFPSNQILEDLMVNFFLSPDQQIIYTTKASLHSNAARVTISAEDITLTRIVVNILGSYYKNQNIEKWKVLFKKDELMMGVLLKASSLIFYTQAAHEFRNNFLPKLKSLNILPWKMKADHRLIFPANDLSVVLMAISEYQPKCIDRWIKEFPVNDPE